MAIIRSLLLSVSSGVDQSSVHPHLAAGALHTTFKQMRHAERLADFAQVAGDTAFVLHCRRPANDFQIGDPSEIGQDFVLHAIGEEGVLLVYAQILEGKNRDTL